MYRSFILISFITNLILISYIECQNKDQVCYGEFGCFKKAQLSRNIQTANLLGHFPDSPERINVAFHLFSCRDRYNPTILPYNATERDLQRINYDPKKRTIFVIHGFLDNYDQFNWMGDVKDHILRLQPCTMNVIVVDWRGGTHQINYLQAASNTRLVGAIIASFIEKLNNVFRTTNDHYTIMGHSLGGQICGFAGKRLRQPKVRLILSLDPAGPAFNDVNEQNRLNPDDAQLVVSIHTNGGVNVADGFGILKPSGHYSFFPNGGETQPGCSALHGIAAPLLKGLYEGIQETAACSHLFVYKLIEYDEIRDDDFESMAYRCENYKAYEAGRCGTCRDGSDDCKPFGRWYDWWQEQKPSREWREPIIYYIDTKREEPYSYFFYQIKVRTGNDFAPLDSRLFMNITGSLRSDFSEKIIMDRKFEPNKEYTYLHKSKKSIGRVEAVHATLTDKVLPNKAAIAVSKIVTAIPGIGSGSRNDRITVEEIQFNYMNGYTESQRRSMSTVLRNQNGPIEITGKDITHFTGSRSNDRNRNGSNSNRENSNQNRDRNRDRNVPNRDRDISNQNRDDDRNRDRNIPNRDRDNSNRNRDNIPNRDRDNLNRNRDDNRNRDRDIINREQDSSNRNRDDNRNRDRDIANRNRDDNRNRDRDINRDQDRDSSNRNRDNIPNQNQNINRNI